MGQLDLKARKVPRGDADPKDSVAIQDRRALQDRRVRLDPWELRALKDGAGHTDTVARKESRALKDRLARREGEDRVDVQDPLV